MTLRFPEDRLAQFTCSFGAYDYSALTVVGEKGRLHLDPAYESATGLTMEIEIKGKRRRERFAKRDQVAAELAAFARYVREDREPEPSGEEGLADMRVLDAIQRAVESGRSERSPRWPATTVRTSRRRFGAPLTTCRRSCMPSRRDGTPERAAERFSTTPRRLKQ